MTITAAPYRKYPADYPVVSSIGFSGSVDTGVSRSYERGFPSQERLSGSNPTTVSLQFRMTLRTFTQWAQWINAHAVTDWIQINLPSPNGLAAKGLNPPMSAQIVRFGDYTMSPLGPSYVQVSATADLLPQGVGAGVSV